MGKVIDINAILNKRRQNVTGVLTVRFPGVEITEVWIDELLAMPDLMNMELWQLAGIKGEGNE